MYFYVLAEWRADQLLDLVVVVVVVAHAKQRVYVEPYGSSEQARVYLFVSAQCVVGHVAGDAKLFVQQIANVRIEAARRAVSLILPRVILHNLKIHYFK